MSANFIIDAYEFEAIAKQLDRLPKEMQHQVFSRAIGRAKSRVVRRYAQIQSKRIRVPQKFITQATTATASGGLISVKVKTNHIPLHRFGARNIGIAGMLMHSDDFGVRVQGRGTISGAFVSPVSAKRAAGIVMKRVGNRSLPVKSLYGPNPAGEIGRNPWPYQNMLTDLAQDTFRKEFTQGIAYMLSRLGT
ncbi:hypothetical protein LA66_00055 [Aureimonas altamirensis]|uniref:Uncharacterized protein n=1 Tax=Aureimonas altamirensis TaxID=370622 RepID=A0A0B1Q8G4_9HYPH|nr:hypothetical protein [Aureimonas altamirensis]KHJ55120.1 hypothetical protein LA66_00055 [Aureimonas altamirensis]